MTNVSLLCVMTFNGQKHLQNRTKQFSGYTLAVSLTARHTSYLGGFKLDPLLFGRLPTYSKFTQPNIFSLHQGSTARMSSNGREWKRMGNIKKPEIWLVENFVFENEDQ